MLFDSLLDSVGGTPLVGLPRLSPTPEVRLWAKLEDRNPTGSIKDRAALRMFEQAEKDGTAHPGLHDPRAHVGQHRHLAGDGRQAARLPDGVRDAGEHLRGARQLLRMWGAEIVSSPAAGGSNEAVRVAKILAEENPDWVMLYQYGNPANALAHYEGTGPEILADLPTVTHFVAGLGTTGTLMGTGRFFKEQAPARARRRRRAPLRRARLRPAQHGRGVRPRALRPLADRLPLLRRPPGRRAPGARAARGRRASSPASPPARSCTPPWPRPRKSVKAGERADIVFVVCDGGWKYLSTGAYEGTLDEAEERLDGQLWA